MTPATTKQPRPTPAESTARDFATFGPVHLNVTDAERSLSFWRDLIGFELLERSEAALRLGVEEEELVVLYPGAHRASGRGYSGLYHFAIHLPSEAEFARVLLRLSAARYPQSPTDHIMHWATYLSDPDGIGLEFSFETLDRFDHYVLGTGPPTVIDAQGRVRGAVEALDLDEVLSFLTDRDIPRLLPAGTRIGHLHLHVSEVEPAVRFYDETIGFTRGIDVPANGFADLSAGGTFPHRLAVNTWQGLGAAQPPAGTAGLRHYELRLHSQAAVDAALGRLAAEGGTTERRHDGALTRDPAGNALLLATDSRQEPS